MHISKLSFKSLQRIEDLAHSGKTGEALKSIRQLPTTEVTKDAKLYERNILESQILMYMGEFKQALKIAREVLARSQEIEKPLLEIDAYIQMAEIFHCTGKLDQTIKVVKRGKDILKTLEEEGREESPELLQRRG